MLPHPNAGPASPLELAVEVERADQALIFSFSLSGDIGSVILPAKALPARVEGLWRTTCFEAFVRGEGDSYAEMNFAPSGQWAACAFDGYRQGMRDLGLAGSPVIGRFEEPGRLRLAASAILPAQFAATGAPLALSAVIEERDGRKSYWALSHPSGPPDFHHPDCFVVKLP